MSTVLEYCFCQISSTMRFLVLLFIVLGSLSAKSQQNFPTVTPALSYAVPINMFREVDTTHSGYLGLGILFLKPIGHNLPIRAGFEAHLFAMGRRSNSITVTDGAGDYEISSTVSSTMMPAHFILRIDPVKLTNFPITPYFGGVAGIKTFYSRTKVEVDYLDGTEPDTDKWRKINFTLSAGFEAGIHIFIQNGIGIDMRFVQAWGTWGKYIDFSTIEFDRSGKATYERHESRTDYRAFTLGVVINIDN